MLLKTLPEITKTEDGFTVSFTVDENEEQNLYSLADRLEPGREYDISITRHYEKRSASSNNYAWQLIGLISAEVGIPPRDVYKQFILDSFCYRDVLVADADVRREVAEWESQGYGWLCEVLGPSTHNEGFTWIRKFRGSSSFNALEMARFLDNIIFEAQQFGIETEPKDRAPENK